MASVPLQPPHPFNFRNPDDWLKWKRRFEQYRLASGLSGESDARQVSTLLYCLGKEADVLTSANTSEEDRKKLDTVCAETERFLSSPQECNLRESGIQPPESAQGRICGRVYHLPLQPRRKLRVRRPQVGDDS